METMHIAHTKLLLRTTLFSIQGVQMNNGAPMINCPKVQDRLNWMPVYHTSAFHTVMCYLGDVLLGGNKL